MKNLFTTILFMSSCMNFTAQCNYGNDQLLGESSGHMKDYLLGTAIQIDNPVNISHLGMIAMDDNDLFQVAVYDDNNGAPGNLLTSGSGVTQLGEVIVDVPDIVVMPGTYYFMAVFESNSSISCNSVSNETAWYVPHTFGGALPSQLENVNNYVERSFSYFFICEPDVTLSCVNTTIYASNTSADNYQWMECNTGYIVPGANSSSFTGNLFESYYCIVTQNGCSRISECFTIGVTGVEEQDLNSRLVVSPNPSDGQFSIQLPTETARYELTLFNLKGDVVRRELIDGVLIHDMKEDLIPGVYLLQIVSNKLQKTERIIIN